MRIIALNGPKQVGKSTVARAIVEVVGRSTIVSFADPMRAMLRELGVSLPNLVDQRYKEREIQGLGKSARYLMQTLGTEWGRGMINENVWLWAMKRRIESLEREGVEVAVIDDCRFQNEADWVATEGGVVVSLTRDGISYGSDPHASEQPLDCYDLQVDAGDERAAANEIIKFERQVNI